VTATLGTVRTRNRYRQSSLIYPDTISGGAIGNRTERERGSAGEERGRRTKQAEAGVTPSGGKKNSSRGSGDAAAGRANLVSRELSRSRKTGREFGHPVDTAPTE